MSKQRFFVCAHCGNIIAFVNNSGAEAMCCGEKMQELIPNTIDASVEKHMPVITAQGNLVSVTVGSVLHPMAQEHYITWISLECERSNQRKELKPGDEPKAMFVLTDDDKPIAAYAYCNLHSLWKKEI